MIFSSVFCENCTDVDIEELENLWKGSIVETWLKYAYVNNELLGEQQAFVNSIELFTGNFMGDIAASVKALNMNCEKGRLKSADDYCEGLYVHNHFQGCFRAWKVRAIVILRRYE